MGYIYIYKNIFLKKLQFAAYGQFVLVLLMNQICEAGLRLTRSDPRGKT